MPITASKFIEGVKRSLPLLKCTPDGLEELLHRMLGKDGGEIDRERFNIILSMWKIGSVNKSFFHHYFPTRIDSIESFLSGFHRFMRDALWHFGDIRRGLSVLSQIEDIDKYIAKHQFDQEEFESRLPWNVVSDITPLDRGFLGYVSGQRPYSEKEVLTSTEAILKLLEDNKSDWQKLTVKEIKSNIAEAITPQELDKVRQLQQIEECDKIDLWSLSELNANRSAIAATVAKVDETIKKIEKLKEIGRTNQLHYLRNIEMIDVYVATSMRDDEEYIEMAKFVDRVFHEPKVASLNLRYFDPTLCYCDSRLDKGIIECLLVRTAKVTVYCAQDGDTFGKDSELAATLCQGKPVIVYVPSDDSDPVRAAKLDNRAKIFSQFHPLGLQVGLYDGVARGVIVVRSPEECSSILYQILTNSLEVEVHFEEHGVVMREKKTRSIVRTMTGWTELSHCFWSSFGISINPKSGLPD